MALTDGLSVYKATLAHLGDILNNKRVVGNSVSATGNMVLQGTTDGSTWTTLSWDQYWCDVISGEVIERGNDDSNNPVDWSTYIAYQDAGNTAFRMHTYSVSNAGAWTTYTDEALTFAYGYYNPFSADGILKAFARYLTVQYLQSAGGGISIDDLGMRLLVATSASNGSAYLQGLDTSGNVRMWLENYLSTANNLMTILLAAFGKAGGTYAGASVGLAAVDDYASPTVNNQLIMTTQTQGPQFKDIDGDFQNVLPYPFAIQPVSVVYDASLNVAVSNPAKQSYFCFFYLPRKCTSLKVLVFVGVGSGNAKCAIYDAAGTNGAPKNLKAAGSSFATGGAAIYGYTFSQKFNQGNYWLSVMFDNTSAQMRTYNNVYTGPLLAYKGTHTNTFAFDDPAPALTEVLNVLVTLIEPIYA